jgi:hypothetical protein
LLKDPALKLDIEADKSAPDQFGIYHDTYRPKDVNRRTHCYYLCDPDGKECVKSPPFGTAWYETVPQIFDEIQAPERETRNKAQRHFPADVIDLVSKANALVHERDDKLENERATKRRRLLHITASDSVDSLVGEGSDEIDRDTLSNGNESSATEQTMSGPEPPQLAPGYNIWWDSIKAQKLFNASKEKETAVDRLEDLIAVLDHALKLDSTVVQDNCRGP